MHFEPTFSKSDNIDIHSTNAQKKRICLSCLDDMNVHYKLTILKFLNNFSKTNICSKICVCIFLHYHWFSLTAAFLSLRSIVLVELIGLEKLTSSFGLLILFQGSASMAAWPLASKTNQPFKIRSH